MSLYTLLAQQSQLCQSTYFHTLKRVYAGIVVRVDTMCLQCFSHVRLCTLLRYCFGSCAYLHLSLPRNSIARTESKPGCANLPISMPWDGFKQVMWHIRELLLSVFKDVSGFTCLQCFSHIYNCTFFNLNIVIAYCCYPELKSRTFVETTWSGHGMQAIVNIQLVSTPHSSRFCRATFLSKMEDICVVIFFSHCRK